MRNPALPTPGSSLFLVEKKHGPAGPSEWIPGRGHVAKCVCGCVFSSWTWHHVPALYDHLALEGVRA